MAVLKCKMCGGDLDINAGVTVVECEYCGTKQTVPSANDEKKITLFSRANRLRFACEFDKAAGVYESIIADFPEEAEAYWGLVLCKYGIEYVDDPATAKKIPTCHRSSFDPVLDDSNFDLVMENADVVARGVYREEAKQIEELRKGIIEVSSKEEPYDIFICYKETDENGDRTVDSVIAQDVYTELVNKGYRVFFSRITLEDKLGQEYEPYIFAALNSSKIMLAFGTDYEYYNAVWVKNEWSRFLQLIVSGEKKTLIPCYKDIDAYDMPKEFAKLLAQDMGKVGAIQDLLRGIEKILPRETAKTETVVIQQSASNPTVDSYLERAFMFLEDGKWKDAKEYCEKALDIDPKCAKAYLGKLMADLKIGTEDALKDSKTFLEKNSNYEKILKFADDELATRIKKYNNITICTPDYNRAKRILNSPKAKIEDLKEAVSLLENVKEHIEVGNLLAETKKNLQNMIDEFEKSAKLVAERQALIKKVEKAIAKISYFPIALSSDGTIITISDPEKSFTKQIETIKTWTKITKIVCDGYTIIGLRSDGTVVANGENKYGECNIDSWTDIIDIATSGHHTVGLKSDGTVVATGKNENGQCDISEWKDIVSISVYIQTTYGLKKDGTVIATGDYNSFENARNVCALEKQRGKYAILSNGKLYDYFLDENDAAECQLLKWENLVSVSYNHHAVGLKVDGTVVAVDTLGEDEEGKCNVENWSNVVAVYADTSVTFGITEDGRVLVVGDTYDWKSEISSWKLFDSIYTYEQEQQEKHEKRHQQVQQKLMSERREQNLCQHCGGTFKGLFTKKCSSCGKEKDY